MHYLVLFTLVLVAGLIPAFGPPSWVFAVYFYHRYHLNFIAVITLTAFATTLGRLLLALGTRFLNNHLPKRFISSLNYAKNVIKAKKKNVWVLVGLFVISPLPSAQLFEAAGLLGTNLLVLGAAFFIGRLVSSTIYLLLSAVVAPSINEIWLTGFTSPWALIAEILCILALLALINIRWIITKIGAKSS